MPPIFLRFLLCNLATVLALSSPALGQVVDIAAAFRLYDQGKYQECIAACEQGIKNAWRVDWRLLKMRSEIRLGQYAKAMQSAEQALENHTGDIRVRWDARRAYQLNNELEKADTMLSQIDSLVKNAPWRYSDAEDRIVLGTMMLEANADAKKSLGTVL